MTLELAVVLLLILVNGFFALSEMSVVTARKPRLRQRAEESRGARTALELAEHPERFLSTVQVGITLIGVLTGVFGGASIGARIAAALVDAGVERDLAEPLGIGASVALITYLTIVFGELLPKRIALIAPEPIAATVALPMRILSRVAAPFVWLLSLSTRLVLRITRLDRIAPNQVTEEEIRLLVAESAEQGVIDAQERNMVTRALTFGDRTVGSLMTPRTKIAWLDATLPLEENLAVMRETPYSRYPVRRGSEQDVIGVLQVKSLLDALAKGQRLDLFRELAPPVFVPEAARATHMIEKFRESESPLALVVDEYGDIAGLVTLNDLLVSVFGRLAQGADDESPTVFQREDGSWLVDGGVGIEDLRELTGLSRLPLEDEQDFRTVAGLVMAHFGRIPGVGEHFTAQGFRFEVVDLDGARIDKVLIARSVPPDPDNLV